MELVNSNESKISNWRRAVMLAGGLGLVLLAGCGDDDASTDENHNADSEAPTIEVEYYQNGNRLLSYHNDDGDYADILQSCDGGDLLEQTAFNYRAGNDIQRTRDFPACADGRLTEEDFQTLG